MDERCARPLLNEDALTLNAGESVEKTFEAEWDGHGLVQLHFGIDTATEHGSQLVALRGGFGSD